MDQIVRTGSAFSPASPIPGTPEPPRARAWLRVAGAVTLVAALTLRADPHAQVLWPRPEAPLTAVVEKTAGSEMTDRFWAHLHHGEAGVMLHTRILQENYYLAANAATEVRYTVRGVPVSGWMPLPATFGLDLWNPALTVKDGIHDLSVEVRGVQAEQIKPYPMFLHVGRHQAVEETVPVIAQNMQALENLRPAPFGTAYVRVSDRRMIGYPADPTPGPWTEPPHLADLYQEPMQPHSDHFEGAQMWWEEPPGTISEGLKFVRALAPKTGEYFTGLYNGGGEVSPTDFGNGGHRTFPIKDGPRGVGWTDGYLGGQVDSQGGFVHVNKAGAARYMKPDGELITVAGWRVRPDKDPVWVQKPLASIRTNMEFRGTWLNGLYADPYDPGFHQPMDITIDPLNESVWYIAGIYDHCIWKLVVDKTTWVATVSVFAGDPSHRPGYVDGVGHAARFNKPYSLVFDPVSDAIYVSDFDNDAIRKIARNGTVSTVFGATGFGDRLLAMGLATRDDRVVANPVVAADNARLSGTSPDVFAPYTVRVDSRGRLIVFDRGFNTVRRFDLATSSATVLVRLQSTDNGGQTWTYTRGGFGEGIRGWAWLDVDRYGRSGPLDSIYLAMAVSYAIPRNETTNHFNEEWWWISADGGEQRYVSRVDVNRSPDSWGPMTDTDLPHYPWGIAVDPRGGLYLAGIGEHGITKIRKRRSGDPMPPADMSYYDSKRLWVWGTADMPYYTIPRTSSGWGVSPALVHGWEGHNYLGFADAWGYKSGYSADAMLQAFGITTTISDNSVARQRVLDFIRLNGGQAIGSSVPAPSAPSNVRIVR